MPVQEAFRGQSVTLNEDRSLLRRHSLSTTETARIITITDGAASKVAELLGQEPDGETLALRVGVRPGGCSGFSYDMFFDSEIADDDNVDQVSEGVRVVVDPASAQMLQGATLEYTDGLQGSGFHIVNPNASKSCGCGNSFS
jgi:iron-sulfur cluster assembly accessory protein